MKIYFDLFCGSVADKDFALKSMRNLGYSKKAIALVILQKKNVAFIYNNDANVKKTFMIAITESLKSICEKFGNFIYANDGQLFVVFENYEKLENCIEQISQTNFKTL